MPTNPLVAVGGSANDGTGDPLRTAFQKVNRLPCPDQTINAACGDYSGTHEQQITAAGNDALARAAAANKGNWYVWIPRSWCPFATASVPLSTWNAPVNGVKMIREDGNPDYYDVIAYGAAANGIQDDAPAILAAVTAANSRIGGGTVHFSDFGANTYLMGSAAPFVALTDITFLGEGQNGTRILMTNGVNAFDFSGICARVKIRDFQIGPPGITLGSGIGLQVIGTVGVHSDTFVIENITIQNAPTPIFMQYVDNSFTFRVRIFQTLANATTGVALNLNSCNSHIWDQFLAFATVGTFANEGVRIDYDTDTIVFSNSQVLFSNSIGWRLAQTAGSTGPRLCRLTNCYSESNTASGFQIEAARDVRLSGCHAAVNLQQGYQITGGDSVTITDSFALQNQQHGFAITGGTGTKIDGCTASNNSQQTNNTYDGITVSANVLDTRLIGNRSGDFVFSLANKQRYGISLGGGTSDYLTVVGNNCKSNQTGFILNGSSGTHNMIAANVGFQDLVSDAIYAGVGVPGAAVATRYRLPAILLQSGNLSTTATSDTSITTFTLLGTTLGTAFSAIRIRAGGRQVTQNGSFNIKFGATVLFTVAPLSGENWHCDVTVTRIGSTTERATGLTVHAATVAAVGTIAGETLASDILIDFRGSVTSGGTLNIDEVAIEYLSSL